MCKHSCILYFSLKSQSRTSCYLALLWQPGAPPSCCCVIQFQLGLVLPDSMELAALSDVSRMKWAVLSPYPVAAVSQASTYLQREIHDPLHASLWGSVHQWLGWSGKSSVKTAASLLCRATREETRSILSGMPGSRSNGNMPRVHFIPFNWHTVRTRHLKLAQSVKLTLRRAKNCRVRWAACSLFIHNIFANQIS